MRLSADGLADRGTKAKKARLHIVVTTMALLLA